MVTENLPGPTAVPIAANFTKIILKEEVNITGQIIENTMDHGGIIKWMGTAFSLS